MGEFARIVVYLLHERTVAHANILLKWYTVHRTTHGTIRCRPWTRPRLLGLMCLVFSLSIPLPPNGKTRLDSKD